MEGETNFNINEDIALSEKEIKAKKPWYKRIDYFKALKIFGAFYLFNLLCINTVATIRFYHDIAIPFLKVFFSKPENVTYLILTIISMSLLIYFVIKIRKAFKK